MVDYSIKRITKELIEEIKQALKSVERYGSVELYVQDDKVTQITVRNIKKTNHDMRNGKMKG
jgi:hypothetical protein